MNGIASFLDKSASAKVEFLWQELEHLCGLVGVKATPFPHFSWQVSEAYDLSRLELVLGRVSRQSEPLTIHTAGLGLFTGENPIVYLPIIKDIPLINFHASLWELMVEIAICPSLYYSPTKWIPHITLAYNDVNLHNLECALKTLANQSFEWEIQIDNIVSIVQDRDRPPETVRYCFGL